MQMPDLSRRTTIALVVVVAGIIALILALLGGSDSSPKSSAGGNSSGANQGIDPLSPLSEDEEDRLKDSTKGPLEGQSDPFAVSFGAAVRHKVTIRASANGALRAAYRFRDGRSGDKIVANSFSTSHTFVGAFPVAQVGVRIAPNADRGSCSITVDGVEVVSRSTNQQFGVVVCTA